MPTFVGLTPALLNGRRPARYYSVSNADKVVMIPRSSLVLNTTTLAPYIPLLKERVLRRV
nr:MAG TPA: hypothetical protein [Caudoviricetes sp.]